MPNVEGLSREELSEFEELFAGAERANGLVPSSLYAMGRRPEILRGFVAMFGAVMGRGTLDPGFKQLVAQIASTSAGCRYCQAHTATFAERRGVPAEKVAALYEFETSPHFDAAERAALRLARDAALVPNATTPGHFEELREHYSEEQIVELVATIAAFGFLNRWNDTMATELEEEPFAFASEHLHDAGWEAGKHRDH